MIGVSQRANRFLQTGALCAVAVALVAEVIFGAGAERWGAVAGLCALAVWRIAHIVNSAERRRLADRLARLEAIERQFASSEQRLHLAQHIARVGTWDDDLVSGVSEWSDSLRELYGVDAHRPGGYPSFLDLVHPDDRSRVRGIIDRAIQHGGDFEYEHRLCRPDGDIRWFLSRGHVITGGDRALRLLGVAMDISDLKREEVDRDALEHQLRQAHKLEAVGQLAGGVAHDFNNLLLAIRGYAELGRRALSEGGDPVGCLDEIVDASDRAAVLTRQLLAFSRRQVLHPENVDLNEVVAGARNLLHRLIGEDIEFLAPHPESEARVEADRGQLEQVIVNLVVNARDAMPDGGTLTLRVETAELAPEHRLGMALGSYAVLAVSDTGCGMDAETSARIFEPFFTTKDTGNGLGLATVHGIVTQSGGTIVLDSTLGEGTTFKVYLPLVAAPAETLSGAAPVVKSLPLVAGGSGETILLVEDDDRVRAIVGEMLESRGYIVLRAHDGDQAVAIASSGEVELDLLLSDLVMPGIGGREVARRVAAFHSGLSVLHMSGYSDDDVIRRGAVELGGAFLEKPFTSEELARKVRQVLDESVGVVEDVRQLSVG